MTLQYAATAPGELRKVSLYDGCQQHFMLLLTFCAADNSKVSYAAC